MSRCLEASKFFYALSAVSFFLVARVRARKTRETSAKEGFQALFSFGGISMELFEFNYASTPSGQYLEGENARVILARPVGCLPINMFVFPGRITKVRGVNLLRRDAHHLS